jgi:hypothetical protein
MEMNKTEVAQIEKATLDANESQMRELNDSYLSFIGGGIGEVIVG